MKEVFVVVAAEDEENQTAIAAFDNEEAARHKANFVWRGEVITLPIQPKDETPEILLITATYDLCTFRARTDGLHYTFSNEELRQYENKVTLYCCYVDVYFSKNITVSLTIYIDRHLLVDDWRDRLEKYLCNLVDQSQRMLMSYDKNAVREFLTNKIKADLSDNRCV